MSALTQALLRLSQYWASLEVAFQRFVVDLASAGPESLDLDTGWTPALGEWVLQLRRSATNAMNSTLASVGDGARSFRALAEAESAFRRALNAHLGVPISNKEVIENDTAIA